MGKVVDIKSFAKYVGLSMLVKGLSVSPLKLQKILYYEQAWHMVFFGREEQLFDTAPQAWVNGPVYPSVYSEYKNKVAGMCDHLEPKHFNVKESDIPQVIKELSQSMNLTDKEIQLSDSVITLYGSKTQNQLIFVTHSEKPWCDARGNLLPFESSQSEISLDTMYSYYKERYNRNHGS